MTITDITPGSVYTNGNGRFRVVTGTITGSGWSDVRYVATYQNTKGMMKPTIIGIDRCRPACLASWSEREATPAEIRAVIAVAELTDTELSAVRSRLKVLENE